MRLESYRKWRRPRRGRHLLVAALSLWTVMTSNAQEHVNEMDDATIEALGAAAVERAAKDVDEHGWHLVLVVSDDGSPGFLYTVGLWKTYHHPEIILFAPEHPRGMTGWMSAAAKRVVAGERFEAGKTYEALAGRFSGAFRAVDPSWILEFLGIAAGYYETADFPVMQLFWPDADGRFPWDDEFAPSLRPFQPPLFEPAEDSEDPTN